MGRRDDDAHRAEAEQALKEATVRRRVTIETLLPLGIAAALVLLVVCAVLSVVTFVNQGKLSDAQDGLVEAQDDIRRAVAVRDAAVRGSCVRLQLVRDDINVLSSAVFRVLTLARRGAGNTEAAELFGEITRSAIYLPPTDCDQAVDSADSYRPPRPVPFATVAACFTVNNVRPEPGCPQTRRGPAPPDAGRFP